MVEIKRSNLGLKGFITFFSLAFLIFSFAAPDIFAGKKPKKHVKHATSHSTRDRSSKQQHQAQKRVRYHVFKVERDRVAKLKKSSFLNKRPYQFASPIVEGDRLYVGVDAGFFYAVDIAKGKKIWEFKSDGPIHSKATFSGDTVYVGDSKAYVYAINAENGQERWRSLLDAEVLTTPLVSGSKLYAADMSGRLYALDLSTGTEVWHTDPNDRHIGFSVRRSASPVASGGIIYLGTASGALIAFHESNGTVAWVRQLGNRSSQVYDVDSTPVVANGMVFAASADGETFGLDAASGRVVWSADAGGVNDILYSDGKLYVSGGGVLSALDPATGNIFWEQNLNTPEISSPAAGENFIAVVSAIDKLYLIDRQNGDIAYERYVKKGSLSDPVVVGSNLYVLSNSGSLYSFKVRNANAPKSKN